MRPHGRYGKAGEGSYLQMELAVDYWEKEGEVRGAEPRVIPMLVADDRMQSTVSRFFGGGINCWGSTNVACLPRCARHQARAPSCYVHFSS